MEPDTIKNFPDYLKDFEELKAIAETVDSIIYLFEINADDIPAAVWVDDTIEEERWKRLVYSEKFYTKVMEVARASHYICPVVTLTELEEYLAAFIRGENYTLEYDCDNPAIKIRTTDKELTRERRYNILRKIVPMNTELIIEYVENL